MIALTGFASVTLFVWALQKFGVIRVSLSVKDIALNAFNLIQDRNIDDDKREKEIQKSSIKLFGVFFSILLRSIMALAFAFLPILLVSLTSSIQSNEVIQFLSKWYVIGIASVLVFLYYFLHKKYKMISKKTISDSKSNYNQTERIIHQFAFSSLSIQFTGADAEKLLYRNVYQSVKINKPIFITSLPRAGTTLLLEVLSRFPSLASHTYRDMPFLMMPLLWSRLSSTFQKQTQLKERVHGDGVKIGYDSPEAFEEVLWKTFWPEKYTNTHIQMWNAGDINEEARNFLIDHMKKIIALRRPNRKLDGRYISKNNANIARLNLIKNMFPDAKILIPIRHPIEHAGSLLRQHQNFLQLHDSEPFIRRYMADIGHYEFGDLHRPIAFPNLEELLANRNLLSPDYWLSYWVAAFEYLQNYHDLVNFISYEKACREGKKAVVEICRKCEIPEENMLNEASGLFRSPPPPRFKKTDYSNRLMARAEDIYDNILNLANTR